MLQKLKGIITSIKVQKNKTVKREWRVMVLINSPSILKEKANLYRYKSRGAGRLEIRERFDNHLQNEENDLFLQLNVRQYH